MVIALSQQRAIFRTRVKEYPDEVVIENRPGYEGSGGGSADLLILVLRAIGVVVWRVRRKFG